VSALVTVLARHSGLLRSLACALGLHGRSVYRGGPRELCFCPYCGVPLVPGWTWSGTSYEGGLSLLNYRVSEGTP
jgi:hypothetical protein